MERSILAVPPRFREVDQNSRPRSRIPSARSTLALPPAIRSLARSTPHTLRNAPSVLRYDMLSLVQYVSDNWTANDGLEFRGTTLQNQWPVCGRGRTFVVRRYSEGTLDQIKPSDNWRPSQACKCLRPSMEEADSF